MLQLINKDEFNKMYSIMEQSFPPDEYRPFNEQLQLLENTMYKLYVNKDETGTINAFIALWEFNDFVFIEHFAVSENARNLGLGSKILSEVISATNKIICLEVEHPESDVTKRRIEFYKRNGFYLNAYPYIQPPISAGKAPVPLMIMTSNSAVDENVFLNIKQSLYKTVYKITSNNG